MLNTFLYNTTTLNSFWAPTELEGIDLGRFQRGDKVPIYFTLPGWPDGVPIARLDGTSLVFEVPLVDGFTFGFDMRLSGLVGTLPLGPYRLIVDYTIGGVPGNQLFRYTLVDGGDSGGEVISMFCLERPEMSYVVAQLGAGMLVQGRNPHL